MSRQLAKLLCKGEIAALARAITLVESRRPGDQEKSDAIAGGGMGAKSRRLADCDFWSAWRWKINLDRSFGLYLLELGKKVAVLAIDPSSSRTGGAILGR